MDERAMGAIVRRNLALMDSEAEGGMVALVNTESIGRGQLPDGRTCDTANFFFDRQTGEIIAFNNPQHVPARIQARYGEGSFRIAHAFTYLPRFKGLPRQEILETFYDIGRRAVPMDTAADVSADAKRVLRLTAESFNATHR